MAAYTKTQNFTALRGSTPADPAILDTEFNAVATAVNSKADVSGGSISVAADASVTSAAGGASLAVIPANKIYMHSFQTGTKMAFFQASAPLGWTKDTANNDAVLRVVSATGGGTGGAGSIATGVVMPTITAGHTLTVNEIPSHTHSMGRVIGGTGSLQFVGGPGVADLNPTSTAAAGGGAAHTHAISAANWIPKYIDVIVCTKD